MQDFPKCVCEGGAFAPPAPTQHVKYTLILFNLGIANGTLEMGTL